LNGNAGWEEAMVREKRWFGRSDGFVRPAQQFERAIAGDAQLRRID